MRKLFATLIILFSMSGFASANSTTNVDPSTYLEAIAGKLIADIEKNKQALKTDDKLAEKLVRQHLLPIIDIEDFSSKTLGSNTWDVMSASQRKLFIDGYINQVISKYAKGLAFYDGQAFIFEASEISNKSGNARVKSSMRQDGDQPLSIDYILSPSAGAWLITNIYVEGTNMRKSYKNQYLPRINEIGMDKFIQELNAPATKK